MIDSRDEFELFNIMQMQGVYSDWSRTLSEGMNNLGGNYYLVIPNGWEGRLRWYQWWVGKPYWDGEADNVGVSYSSTNGLNCNERDRDRYHKQHQLENEYIMHDRLIIYFGKATNFDDDTMERDLVTDEVDVVFKIKVVATGTIKFNLSLGNASSPKKVVIDYGDGYSSSNLSGSHTYTSSGPYTLVCRVTQGSTVERAVMSDTNNQWEMPNKWLEVSNPNMVSYIAFNKDAIVPRPYILNFSGLNMPVLHLDSLGGIEKKERVMFRDCNITNVMCWHRGRIAYIWLSGNSSITSYHTASNIETIYIVGQNRIEYSDSANMGTAVEHYTNIKFPTNVYVHSDRIVNIYGYSYDRNFCDYTVPNITFYVKNSILTDMKKLYPMIKFVGW